ncbi:hypothetical protein Tco_0354010, partial [Tanacetum coccineum]
CYRKTRCCTKKEDQHVDIVQADHEVIIWLGNLIVQALIGVSNNKSAMTLATRRFKRSGKNTINAEMQQHDCKVNIMLQRHQG